MKGVDDAAHGAQRGHSSDTRVVVVVKRSMSLWSGFVRVWESLRNRSTHERSRRHSVANVLRHVGETLFPDRRWEVGELPMDRRVGIALAAQGRDGNQPAPFFLQSCGVVGLALARDTCHGLLGVRRHDRPRGMAVRSSDPVLQAPGDRRWVYVNMADHCVETEGRRTSGGMARQAAQARPEQGRRDRRSGSSL